MTGQQRHRARFIEVSAERPRSSEGSRAPRARGKAQRSSAAAVALLLGMLHGCGGGASDQSAPQGLQIQSFAATETEHFVGEPVGLIAVFSGGTGRVEPGGLVVTSGQAVQTSRLTASATFRLTVTDGAQTVSRELPIEVRYRDRLRALSMPFARAGHVSVELPDGRILVIGGSDESGSLPTTNYAFDPQTETFAELGALIDARIFHAAVVLDDGYVLVVGGDTRPDTPDAELLDGRTGVAFTTGAPVQSRYAATATLLDDGTVLVSAGFTAEGLTATAELYDPRTHEFAATAGTLNYARFGHSANLLPDGRVLIYGGFRDESSPLPPEIYDPRTQLFTVVELPEMTSRGNHVALALQDGAVGIFGGQNYFSLLVEANLRFDPTSGAFEPLAAVLQPRTQAQATLLTDGRVLLAGGLTLGGSNTEIIASDVASSVEGPRMSVDRLAHTVNRLRNGKVLIIGGVDFQQRRLASAEVFE
jgi:hypothetical protein